MNSIQNFEEAANLATEFIYSIENMPHEVRYFLEEIKYKDIRAQELQKQIDSDSARWIRHTLQASASSNPESTPSTKKSTAHLPARIQHSYNEIEKLSNEKILLSQRILDLIYRTCARLDVDLKKVRTLQGETVIESLSERDSVTPAPSINTSSAAVGSTGQEVVSSISDNLRHALNTSIPVSEPNHQPSLAAAAAAPATATASVASVASAPPATKKRRTTTGAVAVPSIKVPPVQSRSVSPAAASSAATKSVQSSNHGRSRLARQVHPSPTKAAKPAKAVIPAVEEPPIKSEEVEDMEEDERLYCFCQEPSHGNMIGCENEESCPYEWFHLGCVGLVEAPSDAWYCPLCRDKREDSKPNAANKTKKGRKK
ncbi:hypothetical protein K435DRAFT_826404 [Dendrothele bispora CBS 962.96]|uniref:Chromatin modification-related protein n=1 Tax=Dendrothele bispora (strain CBS 962.96) TaxID=1314807 RepID=A0A4S8MR09_DENBC|nr:hypothetical protein K435DRAFT_826404 [Dendrothele bispora CBS 962.96]